MARNSSLVVALAAVIAAPVLGFLVVHHLAGGAAGLRAGEALPASELIDLDGDRVDTRSWRDAPTLLVLYQSTCNACEREIEGLTRIAPALPRLRIVLLSLDCAAPRVRTGLQVICDPSGRLVRKLRKLIVPTLYLVNETGSIVYTRTGLRAPETELATLGGLLGNLSRSEQ